MIRLWTLAVLLSLVAAAPAAEARPHFFVHVRAIKESADSACKLATKTAVVVQELLAEHAKLTTTLGVPLPKDKAALAAVLKKRHLEGYAIVVRITRCEHALYPPKKGKVYKTLMVDVATAVDAEKIPSGQMALAGSGDAQVGTEVTRIKKKELASLRIEALTAAIKQSIARFVAKLGTKPTKKKRRRQRRRRRR